MELILKAMELILKAASFVNDNLLATYGALVGSLALVLNFMRYRHAVSGTKVRLRVEIRVKKTIQEFNKSIESSKAELPEFMHSSSEIEITHEVVVRNLGNVAVNLQEVWVETSIGRINGTTSEKNSSIFNEIPKSSGVELPPRTMKSFALFSRLRDGYLVPRRAYVVDAMGTKWRSQQSKMGRK